MRCACVDIGSNTTRLLVAEPDPGHAGVLRVVEAERAFLRLRSADPTPQERAALAGVVRHQLELARAAGAARVRVVGTAALRCAPGLAEELAAAAGVAVEVLTGQEEARLAFLGATAALPRDGVTVAVVDVGGGSTEIAAGTPGGAVRWWASLPVGSGVVTDAHLPADPPEAAQLERARAAVEAVVAAAGCPGVDQAWAVGGSATSLRRFVGEELSAEALDRALAALAVAPSADAAARLGLHAERARLLPAGLLLLGALARALGCPLRVGGGGLREGVVLDLLQHDV
ncbi:MAG: hypothetical protein HZB46_07490 [Solirubrobacterales bacterium]|nr:hypothetical protein [Solirubrobacterales bacterium]